MIPQSFSRPKYRPDVDGMRALAILSVLIFHAYPSSLPGGFVGVDIFFVISGYLISSIIFRGLTLGTFSFFDFYARRVRRIFPAVSVVILGSFILGFYFLSPDELESLTRESPYAAFFLENWRLYVTTGGYWETATELKPFMHFWSLGVEEQYYIFYPLICFLLWKVSAKRFLASLVFMLLVSFSLCLYDTVNEPVRAFYSLHTRFWELLIGGVLAYVELKWPDYKERFKCQGGRIDNVFSIIGLFLIVFAIAFFEEGKDFPGWRALFPTVGSVLIIAAGTNAYLNKYVFSNKVAVFIGLISYPLYLWHWPFICIFRNNLAGELPSGWLMVTLIGLSFLMAYLTYTLIERPMRSRKASWQLVSVLVLVLLLLSVGVKVMVRSNKTINHFVFDNGIPQTLQVLRENLEENQRLDKACVSKFGSDFNVCRTSGEKPSVLILGDSHAHLMWNYLKDKKDLENFYLIGRNAFFVFKDAYYVRKGIKEDFVPEGIWNVIENSSEIDTLVFRGYWGNYLLHPLVSKINPNWSSEELFINHWRITFQDLHRLNKKVFVVLDNPVMDQTRLKRCVRPQRICLLPRGTDCEVSVDELTLEYQKTREILIEEASKWDNVKVIDPVELLCPHDKCPIQLNGKLLYVDDNHLSVFGNEILWRSIEQGVWKRDWQQDVNSSTDVHTIKSR